MSHWDPLFISRAAVAGLSLICVLAFYFYAQLLAQKPTDLRVKSAALLATIVLAFSSLIAQKSAYGYFGVVIVGNDWFLLFCLLLQAIVSIILMHRGLRKGIERQKSTQGKP